MSACTQPLARAAAAFHVRDPAQVCMHALLQRSALMMHARRAAMQCVSRGLRRVTSTLGSFRLLLAYAHTTEGKRELLTELQGICSARLDGLKIVGDMYYPSKHGCGACTCRKWLWCMLMCSCTCTCTCRLDKGYDVELSHTA